MWKHDRQCLGNKSANLLVLSIDRYEVMQFCWLQPEQRPTAEEVHLLLSYLCAKGASEAEEEFERRWNAMKPGGGGGSGSSHIGVELSSFPLLEHFSNDGDDVLTVMETSHGLNFEYKWDQGKAEHLPASAMSPHGAARYHEFYYAASSSGGRGHLNLGVSPSCYEGKVQGCPGLHTPGVVPVLSAHSPSLNSEYYIRIEEAASEGSGTTDLDYTMCSYSPEVGCSSHWQSKESHYDSNNSPTVSLTMEPLVNHSAHPNSHWKPPDYYYYGEQGDKEDPYYGVSPRHNAENHLLKDPSDSEWPIAALQKSIFTDPLGVSPSMTYTYRKGTTDCVALEMEEENSCSSPRSEGGEDEESPFSDKHWTSNTSANNNSGHSLSPCEPPTNDSWCYRHMITFQGLMAEPLCTVPRDDSTLGFRDLRAALLGGERKASSRKGSSCLDVGLPTEETTSADTASEEVSTEDSLDPLTGEGCQQQATTTALRKEDLIVSVSVSEPAASSIGAEDSTTAAELTDETSGAGEEPVLVEEALAECPPKIPQEINLENGKSINSEQDRTPDKTVSSASFPDMDEASDEDTAELTSGVFTELSADCSDRQDVMPIFKSLQKQVETPDSLESLDIPSTTSSCEAFSPTAYVPSSQPKALDSGYDTENYESPEFVLKEPHESQQSETFAQLEKLQEEREGPAQELSLSSSFSAELQGLDEKNPYRDSAYFSDYDTEGGTQEDGEGDSDGSEGHEPEVLQVDNEGLRKDTNQDDNAGQSSSSYSESSGPGGDSAGCCSLEGEEQVISEGDASLPRELFVNGVAADELDSNSAGDKSEETVAAPQTPAPPRSFFLSPVVIMSPEEPPLTGEREMGEEDAGEESIGRKPRPQQPGEVQGFGNSEDAQSNPELSKLTLDLSVVPSQHPSVLTDPEEEEDDTEDSDESDEELRCYHIQEQSEESEEESPTVPIVVAESQSARNLRSLLKMPSLLVEPYCDDLERKKKAVTFYSDVTVYLFDQVTC